MPNNLTLHKLIHELISEINASSIDNSTLKSFTTDPDIFTLFEDSVHYKDKVIFQMYQDMALKQYQKGISYSQYTDFLQLFTTQLINKAAVIIHDTVLIQRITQMSTIIINATAKGYLFELMNDDIPALNAQLDEYVAITHINAHLHWMKRIIYDIENKVPTPSVELNPKKCQFGLWVATNELSKFFTPHEIENIHRMHHSVHNSGESIYYHLKQKKYHQVLLDYLFLSRLSINLVSRLNIKITHQLLQQQIETDPLTQLRNRHALDSILKTTLVLHKEDEIAFTLAMLDIDFFKKVNDTFGHQVGDNVLQSVAKLLKNNVRDSDMIFRYGGEEFLIIFPQCSKECAVTTCEKLRSVIQKHKFSKPLEDYPLTISIGIVTVNKDIQSPQKVIEIADDNLYQAKKEGRNRIVF